MSVAVRALHDATAYYTKQLVVDELLDLVAWPQCGGRLLDPGAGDGAFLLRAIDRLELEPNDIEGLVERVEGWEVFAEAAGYAVANVAARLVDRRWTERAALEGAVRVVKVEDFLAPGPRTIRYRVAAGNPPYLRYARLPEQLKSRYADVPDWARQDLLHAFLDRCSEVLEPGGRIGFVTADRWLFNENSGKLREKLGERFGVEKVRRLDVAGAFYQAKTRRKGTPPRIHPVAVLLGPDAPRLSREPVRLEAVDMPAGARALGEVASIRLAPWLGPEGVFVVPLDRIPAGLRGLPEEAYVLCIDTDDVVQGRIGTPRRLALRTTRGDAPHPKVLRHLDRERHRLPKRALQAQASCRWLPPESWGPLPHGREALLVPRIARELVTYRLPAGVLPINHNLTVVSPEVPIGELERAMRAPHAQAWIAAHAPRLESGYLSITTNLLRKLPVSL